MRHNLPARRPQTTFPLRYQRTPASVPINYEVSVGFHDDGETWLPREVFLTPCDKIGSPAAVAGRDAAVLISLALQHGASLPDLAKSMTRDDEGRPDGLAGAVLDAMMTECAT